MNGTKTRLLLLILINGTMFLFGFLENIKGVSYPLIKNEFDVPYEVLGRMVSLLSFSYTFFSIAAGLILSRFGVKRVYLLGFICALGGLAAIYLAPCFVAVGASFFVLFASFGLFEIGVNGLATQLFTTKAALAMSLLHFLYGAGAIVSPKAAGMLTGAGMIWRKLYLLSVPLVLLVFIPALIAKFPRGDAAASGNSRESAESRITFFGALRQKRVWFFGISLGLMMGIEMASTNWGSLYFQDVYGLDPRTAGATFVSAFFILFTISRLVSGFLVERIGYLRSIFGAVAIITGIFVAGFVLGPFGIYVLPAVGFFVAILWPTIMARAMGVFGPDAPVVTSAMIAVGGLLNASMQLAMGYLNRYLGAAWGYRSCPLFALLLLVMLFLLRNELRTLRPRRAGP
ncbi:MAG: MFS transporter [Treponema sp.]|jgi:fucose permease|nr:MFS transporter [Treponema sp.]